MLQETAILDDNISDEESALVSNGFANGAISLKVLRSKSGSGTTLSKEDASFLVMFILKKLMIFKRRLTNNRTLRAVRKFR